MKATRQIPPAKFVPVQITLETQQEVDAIFSFLNHVSLCKAAGLYDDQWEPLEAYRDCDNSDKIHAAFQALINGEA